MVSAQRGGAGNRVAVIGLGLSGITFVKNLLEQGFDPVGFDRNEYIGGLWKYSTDTSRTTVLRSTLSNVTTQRNAYQDFPFPEDVPAYATSDQVATYIESYADHFKLRSHFRLGMAIEHIDRSDKDDQWKVRFIDRDSKCCIELFDRVVVTTGAYAIPHTIKLDGSEHFSGMLIHAQAFKDPRKYGNQQVVVLGMSNSGCDIAVDLAGVAEKVYISHRAGARILQRYGTGTTPIDQRSGRIIAQFGLRLSAYFPKPLGAVAERFIERGMRKAVRGQLKPEWELLPAPPIWNVPPLINDHILDKFNDGSVTPVPAIQRFLPPSSSKSSESSPSKSSIELSNGQILQDIDAVILCTGYRSTFSILAPNADPTNYPKPEWDSAPYSNGLDFLRLYQGLFSTKFPSSLAFFGPTRQHSVAAFNNADLSAQAVARVWAGFFPLPPQAEMEAWCDDVYRSNVAMVQRYRIPKTGPEALKYERWLNEAAGNRVNQCLGWGWEGWKFWFRERKLCHLILWGIDTPFVYRLFEGEEGARKAWDGAREAIFRANGVKR